MSREIKFRAWDKFRLKMYSVSSLVQDANLFSVGGVGPHIISKDGNLVLLSEIELMQYTGSKDKNGIEIYEGDIIKYYHNYTGEIMREVVFKYGSYGIEGTTKGTHIIFGNILESEREVIGNIYKNPELLKEE